MPFLPLVRRLALACLALLATRPAWAGCTRPLEVPFSPLGREMIVSPEGEFSGVAFDFLAELGRRTGCSFHLQAMPRARAWLLAEQGKLDLIPAAVRTAQRDGYARFYDHQTLEPLALISLKEHPVTARSMAELLAGNSTVDVIRSYNYGPEYMALLNNPALKPRLYQDNEPQLAALRLKTGKIDAVLLLPSVFAQSAVSTGIADKVAVYPLAWLPQSRDGIYLLENRLAPADAALLGKTIRQMNKEGVYLRLYKRAHKDLPAWVLENIHNKGTD
jgi:polar amino acid transport system substrate-binding protein